MEKKFNVTLCVLGEFEDYADLVLSESDYKCLTKILNLINLQVVNVNISVYSVTPLN